MPLAEWHPRSPDALLHDIKARGTWLRFRSRARVLSGCIALLALTGLVAAGSLEPGGSTSLLAADPGGEATTTSAADPSGSTTTEFRTKDTSRSTTTTARDSSDRTTTTTVAETGDAASPSTSEPEVVRGGFDPPSPGTYRYRAETDGTPRTERITYVVLSRGGSETRLRESSDGPAPVANELSWRADGVLVVNPESCDEEGAKVRYVFPMSVGRTWSSDTTCSNEDMGEVRTRATMRILDHTEIGIAGQTVQAWVISVTGKTEVTLRGVTQTHHTDGTEWFSSARGLIVKWVGNTRQTESKAGAVRGSETRELLNLEPE